MKPDEIIREQEIVCKKYKSLFVLPDKNLMVGISKDLFSGEVPINGLRHLPEGQGSGWFFWTGGEIPQDDPKYFKPLHIFHLEEKLPQVLKYLALEPGFRIQIDYQGYEDVWEDKSLLDI
jgi:hypothetical protein